MSLQTAAFVSAGPFAGGWSPSARPDDLRFFLASVDRSDDSDDDDSDDSDDDDDSGDDSGDDDDSGDREEDQSTGNDGDDDRDEDRDEDGGDDDEDHGGAPDDGGTGGDPDDGGEGGDGGNPDAGSGGEPAPAPSTGPETPPSPASPSRQTGGAEPGRPVPPAERALALTPLLSSGGTLPRRTLINEPLFEPYFENNVSPKALKDILAYFGLTDRFAALRDDSTVDIVWLKFERRPTLRGLNVLIDGTRRVPDLAAAVGPLAVLIFRDQATLRQRSSVVPVFGDGDADTAAKATRRPLR